MSVNPFGLTDDELEHMLAYFAAAIDDAYMWGWPHPTPREDLPAAFRRRLAADTALAVTINEPWRNGAPFALLGDHR